MPGIRIRGLVSVSDECIEDDFALADSGSLDHAIGWAHAMAVAMSLGSIDQIWFTTRVACSEAVREIGSAGRSAPKSMVRRHYCKAQLSLRILFNVLTLAIEWYFDTSDGGNFRAAMTGTRIKKGT